MKLSSIAWNLAGLGAPLAAALLAIPPLLALLGKEGFGLLSLVWALTALSGLFDLGLGRATTRSVAELIGRNQPGDVAPTLTAALRLTLLSGLTGAALLLSSQLLDLRSLLHLQQTDAAALSRAITILALCVPIQAAIATYRGACEGLQEFRSISLVRMITGCANFLAPWAMAQANTGIDALTATLLIVRLLALWAFRAAALAQLPRAAVRASTEPNNTVRSADLLRSGGWLTVSAIVSPLLVQADRFAIATLLGAASVTAYALPFDIVTQLLIVVSAVSTVAFPSVATLLHGDATGARQLFRRWLLRVALAMGGVCGVVALGLPLALGWWVGLDLPPESVQIGRWLCLGVWINALGAMYYAWLHAHGRFRHTAVLHLAELPLYAVVLWLLLTQMGVVGAAIAWVLRVGVDSLALFLLARRSPPLTRGELAGSGAH